MLQRPIAQINEIERVKDYPVYYGWVILAVATLGTIFTGPGQTYCVSIFIEHFIADLSLSRSTVSSLYTAGTLLGSFALPYVGRQFDRRGARFTTSVVVLLFGFACMFIGTVQNALMLGVGFFLIRMLGQGSLSLLCTSTINQWWIQRRGPLLGISGTLVALLGLGLTPNIVHLLIPLLGWRLTYVTLGFTLLIFLLPLVFIFFRNKPEDYGLKPDAVGYTARSKTPKKLEWMISYFKPPLFESAEDNWTVDEAIRTPIFWVFNLGKASIALICTGLMFHIVSIFSDNGLSGSLAAATFLPIALAAAASNLVSGFLVERFRLRTMMAQSLILLAVSLFMAPQLKTVTGVIIFGILLGASIGTSQTVHNVAWAKYFGRTHLGAITGIVSTFVVAASALGPLPMGIAHDLVGNYDLTLLLFAIIPSGLAIASFFVDTPTRSEA